MPPKPTFDAHTEVRISEAIEALKAGKFKHATAAATHYRVPYNRLIYRSKGGQSKQACGGHNRALNDDQELAIKHYVDRCELLGFPANRKAIQAAANSILRHAYVS